MTHPDEAAFPEVQSTPQFSNHTYGLTKREYFAAMALKGLLAAGRLSIRDSCIAAVKAADCTIDYLNADKD